MQKSCTPNCLHLSATRFQHKPDEPAPKQMLGKVPNRCNRYERDNHSPSCLGHEKRHRFPFRSERCLRELCRHRTRTENEGKPTLVASRLHSTSVRPTPGRGPLVPANCEDLPASCCAAQLTNGSLCWLFPVLKLPKRAFGVMTTQEQKTSPEQMCGVRVRLGKRDSINLEIYNDFRVGNIGCQLSL